MSPGAEELAGDNLKTVCKTLGIPPVLNFGPCLAIGRLEIVATELAEYLGIDLYVLINKLPKFEPLVYIILFLLLSVVILGISYLISLTILKKKEF